MKYIKWDLLLTVIAGAFIAHLIQAYLKRNYAEGIGQYMDRRFQRPVTMDRRSPREENAL